ncbi:hypothetical protein [Methylobacterium sp. ID0610]|uniref:hypothetical protein n=1 Tax=Methylobacterium carpenticola TaxID=3344827 RepID=UPI003690F9D5
MQEIVVGPFIVGIIAASSPALAADGSRQAAGGALMSTYVNDPRSLHAPRRGSGQILGQPMLPDGGTLPLTANRPAESRWTSSR